MVYCNGVYFLYVHVCIKDEKGLYNAAERGDRSIVRQLIASPVNVDCTPYEVCVTKTLIQRI